MTDAPPEISIGHLRAVTTGTTVDLPDRVVEILAAVGPDTDVLVSDVSARSFAAVIRRTYSKQEPNLVPFIDPLEALGDELVLICQVEHGDELVTAVLRATDRALVAATAIDRSVGLVHITVQELCARLRASNAPGVELALEVASQCPAEERVRIFEQGALSTVRTFLTKYTTAAENGFDVRGLDGFAGALVPLGAEQPGFCTVQADAAVAITAFTPGRTDVLAAMSVGGLSPRTGTTEENG
ncbi:hypothetical protein KK101_08830 [Curtobacterium flaccumfaciens pv. oortii]|uniref:hypothetical protein n=1 Tax=Curtobacterium flaccumfaciens TaxID=2035 RepID=UPI001BDDCFE1|nr:hypothetical protein [Curtobacterium flaccumfaciens]MBT1622787.1 hypothetical protein [Curtobacterium flaccumfaciens pv. oortii]